MRPQDITLRKSKYKVLACTVEDGVGEVVSIAGATINWYLSKRPGGQSLITKSTNNGVVIVGDGESGRFNVLIQPADTKNLEPGLYYHEAVVIDGAGNPVTVFDGTVTVKESQHSQGG